MIQIEIRTFKTPEDQSANREPLFLGCAKKPNQLIKLAFSTPATHSYIGYFYYNSPLGYRQALSLLGASYDPTRDCFLYQGSFL
mgnify:CR=1